MRSFARSASTKRRRVSASPNRRRSNSFDPTHIIPTDYLNNGSNESSLVRAIEQRERGRSRTRDQRGGQRSSSVDGTTTHMRIEQTVNMTEQDRAFERLKAADDNSGREWNTRMPEGTIVLYTDGSALRDGSGFGIYAGPNHALNRSQKINDPPHNSQRAEVLAVVQALKNVLEWEEYRDESVIIRTDALFVVQAINGGTSLSAYASEVEEILELAGKVGGGVQFQHVYAHDGDPGNEAADDLARQATVGARRSRSKSRDRSREYGRRRSRENNRQHIESHSAIVKGSTSAL